MGADQLSYILWITLTRACKGIYLHFLWRPNDMKFIMLFCSLQRPHHLCTNCRGHCCWGLHIHHAQQGQQARPLPRHSQLHLRFGTWKGECGELLGFETFLQRFTSLGLHAIGVMNSEDFWTWQGFGIPSLQLAYGAKFPEFVEIARIMWMVSCHPWWICVAISFSFPCVVSMIHTLLVSR